MLAQNKSPFHLALFLRGVYSKPTVAQEHDRKPQNKIPCCTNLWLRHFQEQRLSKVLLSEVV